MSKERLEIIKKLRETILEENDFRTRCVLAYVFVNLGYMDWLIEQAERVHELETFKEEMGNRYEIWHIGAKKSLAEKEELKQQNKRYREALEEIKKEETVTTALSEGQVAYTFSGHIARKALEESE